MWFLQQWEPNSADVQRRARDQAPRPARPRRAAAEPRAGDRAPREPANRGLGRPRAASRSCSTRGRSRCPSSMSRPPSSTQVLRDLSREPFDLTRDLMLARDPDRARGRRARAAASRMHHIAADAHSDSILFDELPSSTTRAGAGREPRLPELPIQYSDYAVWQRERTAGPALDELVAYWARAARGCARRCCACRPTARGPRCSATTGATSRSRSRRPLAERLVALGREEGATFFMTMLAAFATFLYRLAGEDDVVIGSPIANRNHLELQRLIGFFTNTRRAARAPRRQSVLPRGDAPRPRRRRSEPTPTRSCPFEKVVEAVQPKRDAATTRIFQVNFRAQEAPAAGASSSPASRRRADHRRHRLLALRLRARTPVRPDGLGGLPRVRPRSLRRGDGRRLRRESRGAPRADRRRPRRPDPHAHAAPRREPPPSRGNDLAPPARVAPLRAAKAACRRRSCRGGRSCRACSASGSPRS